MTEELRALLSACPDCQAPHEPAVAAVYIRHADWYIRRGLLVEGVQCHECEVKRYRARALASLAEVQARLSGVES